MENDEFFLEENNSAEQLPQPIIIEAEAKKDAKEKKRYSVVLGLSIIMVAVAFVLAVWALLLPKAQTAIEIQTPTQETEEWRGAFLARDVYERAIESSVNIRCSGSQTCWSGVILSEDGLIATTGELVDRSSKGWIYVALSDGREYKAESVRLSSDGRLALLKINAASLSAVDMSDRELQNGEEILAVARGGDVISGRISKINGETLKVNASVGIGGVGAPLFDNDGYLVGLLYTIGDDMTISCAVKAKKIEEIICETEYQNK